MATARIGLDRLPPAARAAIEEHTGPLLSVVEADEGFNSEVPWGSVTDSRRWSLPCGQPHRWT